MDTNHSRRLDNPPPTEENEGARGFQSGEKIFQSLFHQSTPHKPFHANRIMNIQIQAAYRSRIEVAVGDREASIEWARNEAALMDDDERRRIESMDFRELKGALASFYI